MKLYSKGIVNGDIQTQYGMKAEEEFIKKGVSTLSFPLRWEEAPEGTQSFALTFEGHILQQAVLKGKYGQ